MKNISPQIKGMHCASCAAIITSKISALPGVKKIDVNFATEKARLSFDEQKISLDQMNKEIEKIGYQLIENSGDEQNSSSEPDHHNHAMAGESKEGKLKELAAQKTKVQFSLPLSLAVFALMMWDIASKFFTTLPILPFSMEISNTILMIIASIIVFWIGQPFLRGIVRFIRHGVANMDTLIGIGVLTAYIYSAAITLFPAVKQLLKAPDYTYFDVTIVVIGFVLLGKYLEAKSKIKTGQAIEKLLGLQAKTALLYKDGQEIEIAISEVKIGDVIIVKPGTKIPVDGKIIEGSSSIDESMISGEPIPVDKKIGDQAIGSTINKQGTFKFVTTKIGSDTMLAQIIKMVEDAQGSKAPIQEIADKVSRIFVPIVLIIAGVTLLSWLLIGSFFIPFSSALSFGLMAFVGVLVIACPCALGLATPTAIIVGVGKGAEYGILIKSAEGLEKLSEIDTIVFDKTGTITKGSPEVTDIISLDKKATSASILELAGSVENSSEHPLAQAIVARAKEKKIALKTITGFEALEGVGVKANIDSTRILIRKPKTEESNDPQIKELQSQGKTVVVLEANEQNLGLIALSDTIKDGAKEAIANLHRKKIKVIMLTGDNQIAANYIARQVNIDEVIAGVLPREKSDKVKALQLAGRKVAMAGDGINDAPALVQSDVGIAMATGTDIAIESATVTLLKGDLNKLAQAIDLSRATMRVIKQNLFWAFFYNVIGIPLAAGAFYPLFGLFLNPVFAGLAMAGSSISVVSNSLKLKLKKF